MKKKTVKTGVKNVVKPLSKTNTENSDSVIIASGQDMTLPIISAIAIHCKVPCAYFSNGKGKEEVVQKLLSNFSGVKESKIKTGSITTDEWPELLSAGDMLSNAPLYVDDSKILSASNLQIKIKKFLRKHENGICIVDNAKSLIGK